ncbi:MAG: CRTAC1 family protein, partial [Saprospiraceae bacterium]|nr:CRTAC1 family protein [Saprospiraceae bacterium]
MAFLVRKMAKKNLSQSRFNISSIGFLVASLIACMQVSGCMDREKLENEDLLFTSLSASETSIDFINQIQDQKDFNIINYRNYYNGGGVAIGDVNNDGLNDIFFTANMTPNRLFLNHGDFRFEDITEIAGVGGTKVWSTGVTMADVNADGWLDIYVCNSGNIDGIDKENELFINQKDGTFEEQSGAYGLDNPGYSTHAAFFDYDLDGDLDCYILNNSFTSPERIAAKNQKRESIDDLGGDKLLRNEDGKFLDVTTEAGIFSSPIGFGLGVSIVDVNSDFLPDIYISNDFWERDYLYVNQGDGTFLEELENSVDYIPSSSMGSDAGDLDNDGDQDLFVTDMLPGNNYRLKTLFEFESYYQDDIKLKAGFYYQYMQNCLQVNRGDGKFIEQAHLSGLASTDWSWGTLIFDFDLDGFRDILVCNGIYHDITNLDFRDFISDRSEVDKIFQESGRVDLRDFLKDLSSTKIVNRAFVNQGDLNFVDLADSLGLGEPSFSNGAAYGDLDNDGDLDLVINNVNMPCFVYRNNAIERQGYHYLKINFRGPKHNPYGVGTSVKIFSGTGSQISMCMPSRGFQSAVPAELIFGLGTSSIVDSLQVVWPGGHHESIFNPKTDTTITVDFEFATRNQEFAAEESSYFTPDS